MIRSNVNRSIMSQASVRISYILTLRHFEPSSQCRQQIFRSSHNVVILFRTVRIESIISNRSWNFTHSLQKSYSPPFKTKLFSTTAELDPQPNTVLEWKSRTDKFLRACDNKLLEKNVDPSLHPALMPHDSRWWKELEAIVRFWSENHPLDQTSLEYCFKLIFDIAVKEWQFQRKLISSSVAQYVNDQSIVHESQNKCQEQSDIASRLVILRKLLNAALHLMRKGYKKKLAIKITDGSILHLYSSSEMWEKLQRLDDIPDVVSFTILLSLLALEAGMDGYLSAESTQIAKQQPLDPLIVLKYMEQCKNVYQKPDNITWSAAVNVWAKRARYKWSENTDAPYRADDILDFMHSQSYKPDNVTVGNLLAAWTHAELPEVVHNIFDRYYDDICSACQLCHFHVIRAYSESLSLKEAQAAAAILQKMIKNYINFFEREQQQPVQRSSLESKTTNQMNQMIVPAKPTFQMISLVLFGLAKQGADPENIIRLLSQVQQLDVTLIANGSDEGIFKNHEKEILGMLVKFMGEYARQKHPVYAEKLLNEINDQLSFDKCYSNHMSSLEPDTQLVTACINVWAGSGRDDASEKAESILNRYFLNDDSVLSPDAISFSTVMKAWSQSKRPDAPDRCEAILRQMWKEYDSVDPLLTKRNTIQTRNHSERFSDRQKKHLSHYDIVQSERYKNSIKPNVITYGTVLHTWAEASRAGDPRAPDRAEHVYRDMLHRGIRPNVRTCNYLLLTLARAVSTDNSESNEASKKSYLQKAAESSSLILHEMKVKHSLEPEVLSYIMCATCWLRLCNHSSQVDKTFMYARAKTTLLEMVISLQKKRHNNVQPFTGILEKKEQNNGRSRIYVLTEADSKQCAKCFLSLIQTLEHCSHLEDIKLSHEISDIENMIKSTGVWNGRLELNLMNLRSLVSTRNITK